MPSLRKDDFPKKIKDYPIIKRIGKGGMGDVYLAKHPTLKKEIILKSLSIRNDKESYERFLQEASVMMEFRHQNIVQVYDHFREGRSTYIAMEYVPGKDLNALLNERAKTPQGAAIPVPLALFILYQAALGLHHAHTKNVIHRDIKPHNILLSVSGDVKIVDFGIARRVGANGEPMQSELTQTGVIIGTPAYMSPEQFTPEKELTVRTDIYSLGVVFYQMITGQRPYRNEYTPQVVAAIAAGKFTPAHKIVKHLPHFVRKILSRTINPKINKRYKTLVPLIKRLQRYFKSYNIFEIKDACRHLVLGDSNIKKSHFFIRYNRRRKMIRKAAVRTLATSVVIGMAAAFFGLHLQYETLLRDRYGRVRFEFNVVNMDPDNIYISVDNRTKKVIPKKPRYSSVMYLPKGEHKFTVTSGSYINSKFFYVRPISVQENDKSMRKGQLCDIPISNLWQQDVAVYFRFWDSLTNKAVMFFDNYTEHKVEGVKNEKDNLKIRVRGEYIPLKEYVYSERTKKRAPFYSGNTYSMKVAGIHDGANRYLDKEFQVSFELEQRSVVAHYTLDIAPAVLVIESDRKVPRLLINDKSYWTVYDQDQYILHNTASVRYETLTEKDTTLFKSAVLLPPGEYRIKIGNGNIKKITMHSDETHHLRITKKDGKYIY